MFLVNLESNFWNELEGSAWLKYLAAVFRSVNVERKLNSERNRVLKLSKQENKSKSQAAAQTPLQTGKHLYYESINIYASIYGYLNGPLLGAHFVLT